ncbi:MAG: hypothetical protein O9352_17765 [Rhizobium sp.]|nr:hypothetical protein [Rhizobium sp.]
MAALETAAAIADTRTFLGRKIMPRYYFDVVRANSSQQDLEGTEFSDLAGATAAARDDARHLMAEAVMRGEDISAFHMRIRDDDGKALISIPFGSVLRRLT